MRLSLAWATLVAAAWWAGLGEATPALARGASHSTFSGINFSNFLPWNTDWFFNAVPPAPPTTHSTHVTTRTAGQPLILGRRPEEGNKPIIFNLPGRTASNPETQPDLPESDKNETHVVYPSVLPSALSCGEKQSLPSIDYNSDPNDCLLSRGEMMHNGTCKRLLAEKDCGKGEWLVKVSEEAVCQTRPCPFGQLEHRGRCVDASDPNECRQGQMLYVSFSGKTRCDCFPGFKYDLGSGNCYTQHEQGPCTFGEYLDYSDSCVLQCVPNECVVDGYVKDEATNMCYRKMYHGFCESSYQKFHLENRTVECEALIFRSVLDVAVLRSCQPGFRHNERGMCRETFSVPSVSTVPTLYNKCPFGYIKVRNNSCRRAHKLLG